MFFTISYGQPLDRSDIVVSSNAPVAIKVLESGHCFIDFGKAYFGTISIKADIGQEDSLVVHLGEKLSKKYAVARNPGGTIRYQKVLVKSLEEGKQYRVPLKANQRNTSGNAILLPDSIGVVMPFRYCEIENLQIPITDLEIKQIAYHYRFNDEAGTFHSSDTVLNAIWNLCKHTIKATSFTGYYIDGDRERIPYEADAYINQLSHYCLDTAYSIARRTNQYFLQNPTWPTEWILHQVMLFYEDYLYTGDIIILREHYDELKLRTLSVLEGEGGLISSKSNNLTDSLLKELGFDNPKARLNDIVDWPPAQRDTGWKLATAEGERDGYEMVDVNTVVNAFYYHDLKLMKLIAEALDEKEDAQYYQIKAENAYQVFNDKLFDKEREVYVDGLGSEHASLHSNMFALAFDLVPEEHQHSVIEFIKSRGMACSVYGAQYLLEGLYKHGGTDYGYELLTSVDNDRNWWNMIRQGSSMTWEAWDQKYKPNLDWNHAWGTAPLNIISRYVWGIRPTKPGYQEVCIKPHLNPLEFADVRVPTRLGLIEGNYQSGEKWDSYELVIPDGMQAVFELWDNVKTVRLNGKPTSTKRNQIQLKSGINKIELRIK